MRKGNGGDTGRNDEHKEVIVTKRNKFFLSKTTYVFSSYICLSYRVEEERRKFTGGSHGNCFFREDVMPLMAVLLSRERPVDGRRRRKLISVRRQKADCRR